MNNQKISGNIMAMVGFIVILINAIGYIFNLDVKHPGLVVIGIVFIVIGMGRVRKNKNK